MFSLVVGAAALPVVVLSVVVLSVVVLVREFNPKLKGVTGVVVRRLIEL
jgi:hypothetical protein